MYKLINTNYLQTKSKITIQIYLFTYITAAFISIPGFYAFFKSEYVFSTLCCIRHGIPENASSECKGIYTERYRFGRRDLQCVFDSQIIRQFPLHDNRAAALDISILHSNTLPVNIVVALQRTAWYVFKNKRINCATK